MAHPAAPATPASEAQLGGSAWRSFVRDAAAVLASERAADAPTTGMHRAGPVASSPVNEDARSAAARILVLSEVA